MTSPPTTRYNVFDDLCRRRSLDLHFMNWGYADIANVSSPNGSPPMTFNAKTLPAGDKLGKLVEGAAEYFTSVVDLLVNEWGVRFIK